MNTLQFSDRVELQYFIEDLHSKGFRKDNSKSHTGITCYVLKEKFIQVMLNEPALLADIYHKDNLVLCDSNSGNDNTTLHSDT